MRILQINAVFGCRSTGTIVKDIAETIEKNGGEAFVAFQHSTIEWKKGYKIGNAIDWKLHALFTRITGKQAFFSRRETRKMLRWVDNIKPDIIHLHNIHSNYVNLNLICGYCKENKIPLVLTLHDCWFFTGKCTHFIQTRCDNWRTGCGNCSQLKREAPSWFCDNSSFVLKDKANHLNAVPNLYIVGCSKWITALAKQSMIGKNYITTIYNGVDTNVFNPFESTFRKEKKIEHCFVILGMADKWCALENREGVEKIFSSLHEDERIILVGCKTEAVQYLKQYDKVIPLSYVKDRHELADIYNAADVFINLTHADTLPTVNMESICCGVPVISFDCCGSPELVDSDDGIIVPEWDFEKIIDAVSYIRKHPFTYNVTDKIKKFDKDKCYIDYLSLYENIVMGIYSQ